MSSAAAHAPHLAHHFHDMDHQHRTVMLGMWVFLVTEIMFFGGAFTCYAVYKYMYPVGFGLASQKLDHILGAVNTVVLITSSLTVALAVHYAHHGKQKQLVRMLLATLALAGGFLVIKTYEYWTKFDHGLIPGPHFHMHGVAAGSPLEAHANLFYAFYFGLTGVHALHMIIGAGVLLPLLRDAAKGAFGPDHYAPIEAFGLYWHLVDLIWIFLFPLLYLAGGR